MKKKTRVLVISYTAALVAALAVGLIACRTDADRRQTAMDANYRHAYGEVLNAVQELDAALQKSLYATTPAMACTVCTDIYSHAQTAEMALGVLPVQSHALARIARNIAIAGDYARTLSRSAAEAKRSRPRSLRSCAPSARPRHSSAPGSARSERRSLTVL